MPRSREANAQYMRDYRARKAAAGGSGAPEAAVEVTKRASKEVAPKRPRAKSSRRHRDAVTRMLRATGLAHIPEEAPLVQLVKDLALELDEGGGAEVYSKYLAALKDVRRVLAYSARVSSSPDPAPRAPVEEPADEIEAPAQVNSLAAFRAARGIG